MKISLVVPVLNEEKILEKTLSILAGQGHELIVVDGGSSDRTRDIARRFCDRLLESGPGRGVQQNIGAAAAQGDIFLFVHADTLLPPGFGPMVKQALSRPHVVYGAFSVDFYPLTPFLRSIRRTADFRSRVLKTPYGDQGIFVFRDTFYEAGGFKNIPLMEDLDLVRRLGGLGQFSLVRARARTSSRRWQKQGGPMRTLKNQGQLMAYFLGVPPGLIARWYGNVR